MLRIITTGGTIDKIYFDALSEFEVGEPTVETILREGLVQIPHVVESLFRKDSLEITDDDRTKIRQSVLAAPESWIIITHGTDTMELTAQKLKDIPGKTIVLTGALSPARFQLSDATFNLGLALGAVQSKPEGIYIAMNGQIFDGLRVHKNRQKSRFEVI